MSDWYHFFSNSKSMTLLICKAERLKDCKWAEWKWSASAQVSAGIGLLKSFYFSIKICSKAYTTMTWGSKSTNWHLQRFFQYSAQCVDWRVQRLHHKDGPLSRLCLCCAWIFLKFLSLDDQFINSSHIVDSWLTLLSVVSIHQHLELLVFDSVFIETSLFVLTQSLQRYLQIKAVINAVITSTAVATPNTTFPRVLTENKYTKTVSIMNSWLKR